MIWLTTLSCWFFSQPPSEREVPEMMWLILLWVFLFFKSTFLSIVRESTQSEKWWHLWQFHVSEVNYYTALNGPLKIFHFSLICSPVPEDSSLVLWDWNCQADSSSQRFRWFFFLLPSYPFPPPHKHSPVS